MKKIFCICILGMLLLSILTILPSMGISTTYGEDKWMRTFGEVYYDFPYDGHQTNDGGYIIIGTTQSPEDIKDRTWLIKTNSNGFEEWNIIYDEELYPNGKSGQQTNDDGYIIVGPKDPLHSWIIKTDKNGNNVWDKLFDFRDPYLIRQTNDEGFIVAGRGKTSEGAFDNALLKIDNTGNMLWNKTFETGGSERVVSIEQTIDSGYIIMRVRSIIKTDVNGEEEWIIRFASDVVGSDVLQRNDGGYTAIGGSTNGPSVGWMMKINSDGEITGWKNYSGIFTNYGPRSFYQTNDNGYIITGVRIFDCQWITYSYKLWLAKTDEVGNIQWEKRFGKPDHLDIGLVVQQTADDGFIVIGSTNSYGTGGVDIWLIKTDKNGNTIPLSRQIDISTLFMRFLERFPLLERFLTLLIN